jgi:hypothetical protein
VPLIYRYRDPATGKVRMVDQNLDTPFIEAPVATPSVSAPLSAGFKRYYCTACTPNKAFAGLGVLSMHFAKQHADLKKDKNSWRAYVKEFGELTDERAHT